MKKSLLIIAAMAAISTAALASGKGDPHIPQTGGPMNYYAPVTHNNPVATGGTGVGVGVGIGQGGNGGNASTGPITNTNTATGGQGGQGGRGGDGCSVIGSGNSNNTNLNNNTQGQQQGQVQGQQQAAIAGASSSSSSSSSAGATSSSGGNTLTGGAHTSTQANSVTVTGDTVNYQAQERNPVSSAWAPGVAPTALCALGVSGGAQGVSFGLSFGKAYIDENCQLLEQIRATASVLGDRATAAEMMCEIPAYKAARARAGKPCGDSKAASAGVGKVASARDEGSPVPLLP